MQSIIFILSILGAYFVVSCVTSVYLMLFKDRDGNSGRYKHWTDED